MDDDLKRRVDVAVENRDSARLRIASNIEK
jgi:predicted transcriptional regulator